VEEKAVVEKVPPRLEEFPKAQALREGETLVLSCKVSGKFSNYCVHVTLLILSSARLLQSRSDSNRHDGKQKVHVLSRKGRKPVKNCYSRPQRQRRRHVFGFRNQAQAVFSTETGAVLEFAFWGASGVAIISAGGMDQYCHTEPPLT